ncbi:MAG: ATP-binding cassette domain-containing protein [Deltaproteobacteria bacterium]|nr:ATP-binding cassette domain-containing protein [Deltaproteobacteria bacterium]
MNENETASIVLDDVGVIIGSNRILDSISLEVGSSERVAVLGASGSGKTTLLRVVAGLTERVDKGRVILSGRVASESDGIRQKPHERELAMVFQDLALWPHMSVRRHLSFVAKPGTSPSELAEWIDAVGLKGRERARPAELSGGERQRLALARALACRPRCLLLDEPFTSLDLPLRREMLDLVLAFHEKIGFALLHVTHDPQEARRVAERVILLEGGRIVWDGSAGDLERGGVPALDRLVAALAWWQKDTDRER